MIIIFTVRDSRQDDTIRIGTVLRK